MRTVLRENPASTSWFLVLVFKDSEDIFAVDKLRCSMFFLSLVTDNARWELDEYFTLAEVAVSAATVSDGVRVDSQRNRSLADLTAGATRG